MKAFSLNLRGRLLECERPLVMGILNATPDSFHAASRCMDSAEIGARAKKMIEDGADIIDVGAYSSRPGAAEVPAELEAERLANAIKAIRASIAREIPISVDTFRPEVARMAVADCGADIVNDIYGTKTDSTMPQTVAELGVPYILMHMRGTPADMQTLTDYDGDVVVNVIKEMSESIARCRQLGIADIIADPGFGFAKTLEQNYRMLAHLKAFDILGCPVLVGVSRKSMLTRLLNIDSSEAEGATIAAGAFALDRGAAILRVHDVKGARQSVEIYSQIIRHSHA